MGNLSVKGIDALSKPGRHRDGDGLYLYIAPAGTKSWVQRIVVNGRRRDIGLGPYPLVGLAKARDLAAGNRAAVAGGRDPMAEKQAAKEAARNPAPSVPAFQDAFAEVFKLRRDGWSSKKHAGQWKSTMETYAFPVIGHKTVDKITRSDALAVLKPIWTEKNETATRVRQRMETVMDWAIAEGHRPLEDNPADRSLLKVLPKVRREEKHYQALPYDQVGWAIRLVQDSTANLLNKLAFEFLVLTAARSGAVRNANWEEILWHRRTWGIPASKMKARRVHRVPLSDRAMDILTEAWDISGPDGLIFPASPGGKAVSDMTYNELLRRLGIPAVPHGFRSSFTDWAEEQLTGYSEAADKALAHEEKNKTRRAYKRTDLFEKRIGLMQMWADYVAVEDGCPDSERMPGIGAAAQEARQ